MKEGFGNITIGFNEEDEPIKVSDLKAQGAVTALMKDAMKPNIVQTLEHNLAFIHGGPFANIAHGCNSVMATKMALKLGDYVVTEAGFGADLGAEKFVDIKCRKSGLKPSAAVCVATLKALKYHGGLDVKECTTENAQALENGMENLLKHVDNIKNQYGINVVVAINRFASDTDKEIEILSHRLKEAGVELSLAEVWAKGGEGALDLAEKVVHVAQKETIKFVYEEEEDIKTKIEKIATKIYGAQGVEYTQEANDEIAKIEKLGYGNYPVCIAKTQYSFSDDAKNLQCKEPFKIHVSEVILKTGSEFVVIKTGKIFTMPGLPRVPAAEDIYVEDNGEIVGIF